MATNEAVATRQAVDKFRLDDRTYGDVHSTMWKLGYRNHHEPDCRVFYYFSPKTYLKLVEGAFTYSDLEARYLKLEPTEEAYKKIQDVNRCDFINCLCALLPALVNKMVEIDIIGERCMTTEIMQKHNGTDRDAQGQKKIQLIHVSVCDIPKKIKVKRDDWTDDGEDWKAA